jgi:hypothetical protein
LLQPGVFDEFFFEKKSEVKNGIVLPIDFIITTMLVTVTEIVCHVSKSNYIYKKY